jgi:hypothetical protein
VIQIVAKYDSKTLLPLLVVAFPKPHYWWLD